MKRILVWILFLSVYFSLFINCSLSMAAPLIWVTDDTPGGRFINGGGPDFHSEKPGIEIELYRMVARRLDLDIELRRMSWNTCLHLIEQNRVDAIFPASFKPERMKIGVYPMKDGAVDAGRKTRDNAYYLYTLKNSALDWDGARFTRGDTPAVIGLPEGWAIVDFVVKRYDNVVEEPVNRKLPNLLVHGRLQGFICLETVFDAYLKKGDGIYEDIVKVHPPVWEKPYYLMLSHRFVTGNPALAEGIWNAIREIKQTPAYADMVSRYVE
ncbi:MAG: transporter substrate-binding domain-containing protein [Desulfobacterales bacterium]|nr:transporter substrate-binding domain-containing protein [Desulfobacterales bacterium]